MADFSHFAAPAVEWIDFEKTWQRPKPPEAASPEEIRELANQRTAALFARVLGRPDAGLEVVDTIILSTDGFKLPVRLYTPNSTDDSRAVALYISFHGGGYHLGNLETEDPPCRQILLNTGAAVLNVNYRHTPEWTFPTPVDDAWAAYKWATTNAGLYGVDAERIYVGGVSAGAVLAISVALRALRQTEQGIPAVKGLILGTPAAVHPDHFPTELLRNGYSSLMQNADAPFINLPMLKRFIELYRPDPTHPEFSPLLRPEDSFTGLCRTSFHIAGRDPLRDEGLLLEAKLRAAGVETILQVYPGMPHAFMSLPLLPSAQKWRNHLHGTLEKWINTPSV